MKLNKKADMQLRNLIMTLLIFNVNGKIKNATVNKVAFEISYEEFGEHTVVSDSEVFPYVVALLKKSSYLSAGALIDENWVITDANSLYFTRETIKTTRVRLGSTNYKKGGVVVPIKSFHIHPYFEDRKPLFDIALVMLAKPVRFTSKIYPVCLRKSPREVAASHFIVTSWSGSLELKSEPRKHVNSMEFIKRRRMLTVTYLHPTDPGSCEEELRDFGINSSKTVMCLDPGIKTDPCLRDVGAPVVLNGILWGVISSWKSDNCDEELDGSSLVTLVSQDQVSTWLHATIHGHTWEYQKNVMDYDDINKY